MGRAILDIVDSRGDLELAGVWVRGDVDFGGLPIPEGACVGDDLESVAETADVIVDFSLPAATGEVLETSVRMQKPLVCGVSGFDDRQFAELDAAAVSIPIVYDRNMSQGVAVLTDLARRAAAALGPEFTVEIRETHHVHKKDAPSGTALKLGEAVAVARGQDFSTVAWYEPTASTASTAKPQAESIRFEVERRGEVPGDHEVVFASPTECLTLVHSVTTRQVFAEGAVRAALWIVDKAPGRYGMHDVLADLKANNPVDNP